MKDEKSLSPRGDNAITAALDPAASALSSLQVLAQVQLIQQIMSVAMKDGEHFGRIPGCGDKPTLLKAGAEKLCLTFRLAPAYEIDERNLDRAHREYRVQCTLTSILTGSFLGQGVGTCSTMEGKYRFRQGAKEATDQPVPRAYWDLRSENLEKAQELLGGKGYSTVKVEGKGWMIAKGGEKVENDNPADCYNTVLKMAKKRALVDAVLTATAASDIFTQDLEDISANIASVGGAPESAGDESGAAEPPTREAEVVSESVDFRETRIHFGKNRGLMLSELSPQQVHWYETDWMPKKEVNGPTSVEDLALIEALKAYRGWRHDPSNRPAKRQTSRRP